MAAPLTTSPAFLIYCGEHLIKFTQNLLMGAKQLRKDGYVKHVWVREDIVRVTTMTAQG